MRYLRTGKGSRRSPHGTAFLVDWRAAFEERPDVLWKDGTHLRPEGAGYYVELVARHLNS